jgi:hypothetical protein
MISVFGRINELVTLFCDFLPEITIWPKKLNKNGCFFSGIPSFFQHNYIINGLQNLTCRIILIVNFPFLPFGLISLQIFYLMLRSKVVQDFVLCTVSTYPILLLAQL